LKIASGKRKNQRMYSLDVAFNRKNPYNEGLRNLTYN